MQSILEKRGDSVSVCHAISIMVNQQTANSESSKRVLKFTLVYSSSDGIMVQHPNSLGGLDAQVGI